MKASCYNIVFLGMILLPLFTYAQNQDSVHIADFREKIKEVKASYIELTSDLSGKHREYQEGMTLVDQTLDDADLDKLKLLLQEMRDIYQQLNSLYQRKESLVTVYKDVYKLPLGTVDTIIKDFPDKVDMPPNGQVRQMPPTEGETFIMMGDKQISKQAFRRRWSYES